MTGQGGWPMTVVCTPDGRPFFAGTYFPKERRGGMIGFVELCERIDELWRTQRDDLLAAGRPAHRRARSLGPRRARRRPAHRRRGRRRPSTGSCGATDPEFGGLGRRAEVPAADGAWRRSPSPPAGATGRHARALTAHARRHGRRRHLRPPRRRLRPLRGRRRVAGAALREDALRQRAAHPPVPARLAAHRRGALPPGARRDRRVRAPRPPAARRRHLVGRGRRQRGRGGQVLRVDATRRCGRSSARTPTSPATGTASGPAATSSTAPPSPTACTLAASWPARRRWRRPARRCSTPGPQRVRPGLDDKVLTEWNAYLVAALAEAGAATGEPAWVDAAVETAEFLLANLRRADGRWLPAWQADAGARHLAYATDHGALVDAFTRLAEATGEARWIAEARAAADALLDALLGPRARRRVHHRPRRRGAHRPPQGPDGQRHPGRQRPRRGRPAPPGRPHRRRALPRARRGDRPPARRAGRRAPHGVRPRARGGRPRRPRHHRDRRRRRPPRPARRRCAPAFRPNAVLAWGERYDSPLWEGRDDGRAYVCRAYACQLPAEDVGTLVAQLDTTITS